MLVGQGCYVQTIVNYSSAATKFVVCLETYPTFSITHPGTDHIGLCLTLQHTQSADFKSFIHNTAIPPWLLNVCSFIPKKTLNKL